jgi:hypothetical protein
MDKLELTLYQKYIYWINAIVLKPLMNGFFCGTAHLFVLRYLMKKF